jgi:hypothetical protein
VHFLTLRSRRFAEIAGRGFNTVPMKLAHWFLFLALSAQAEPPLDAYKHWAFQPPREVAPPAVKNSTWAKTDVDRFVLARLEGANVSPPAAADPRTIIRRMTFDLTGLPPTFEEVEAFTRESASNQQTAVNELADRLLGSPRYGEKWGRHWLDVARFSDTKGYVYGREERRFVHTPAYRDWVIRALNEDLPYDRFLQLQIAADQMVPPSSPDLAAMGFLTSGRRFIGVTHDIIDDRIDVVTRGTLGLTVACARCHDHKFDPIPIEDYYSLYGVFRGSDDRLVALAPLNDKELAKKQKVYGDKLAQRREEANSRLRSRVGDYLAAQFELKNYPEEGFDQFLSADDLIPFSVRRWRDFLHATKETSHPIFAPWHALVAAEDFEKDAPSALARALEGGKVNPLVAAAFSTPPKTKREVAERYGKVFADAEKGTGVASEELRAFLRDSNSPAVVPDTGIVNTEFFFPTNICEELWKLQAEVDRRLIALGTPHALVLAERVEQPAPRVFKRGSPSRLGDEVPRQFLDVLSHPRAVPFKNGSGRLELARAIADASNPLTARVMVNRIWQHHFGEGIVKTSSDFGLRASPPSDPDLLDWLARRIVADGWSMKKMHRLIVTSAAYATASEANPRGEQSVRALTSSAARRLEFEQLRDAMLAASGELDLAMGGKPLEITDAGNRRRTVYTFVDRQFLPGVLRTFDFANPDIHVATRHETTVPQQALFFLNGTFTAARAGALAGRTAMLPPEERVQQLYRSIFQRSPTSAEIAAALKFVAAASADSNPPPEKPRETPWRYGVGEYDEVAKGVKNFTPLAHFTGAAWQGAAQFPGGATAWAQLTAEGGHPGNTRSQAIVRRWIAPRDGVVSVSGKLTHEPEQGDGIRAFIVSSRHGLLKNADLHHSKTEMAVAKIEVKAGDMLDFVADIGGTLSYDQFLWSPIITGADAMWDAKKDFNGPAPAMKTLTPWEQFAQILMLSNEFAFVD